MLMTAERVERAIRQVAGVKPILVPTTDVNSETGLLLAWHADDRSEVEAGETIAEIETSKAIIDVPAPEAGFLLHAVREGAEARLTEPVARLFADLDALEAYAEQEQRRHAEAAESGPRATGPARRRAGELGVDLASIGGDALITVGMVEAAAAAATTATIELPDPLPGAAALPRIALIGAGLGATQVIDILQAAGSGTAVAIADDDASRWAGEVMGVPVVGGFERLVTLFGKGAFDAAIIAIANLGSCPGEAARGARGQRHPAGQRDRSDGADRRRRDVRHGQHRLRLLPLRRRHRRGRQQLPVGLQLLRPSQPARLGHRDRAGVHDLRPRRAGRPRPAWHRHPHRAARRARRRRPGRIRLGDRHIGTGGPRRQTPHGHHHGRAATLGGRNPPHDPVVLLVEFASLRAAPQAGPAASNDRPPCRPSLSAERAHPPGPT